MAIKAIVADEENIQHLIIGLNREDVESLLRGAVFKLPRGLVPVLTEDKSDIMLLFAKLMRILNGGFRLRSGLNLRSVEDVHLVVRSLARHPDREKP